MQLKYNGTSMNVYMGHPVKTYRFDPIGEIPEEFGKHLLKTRPKEFEVYIPQVVQEVEPIQEEVDEPKEAEKFKCDQCDYEATSNAGLSAHKRFKHKEK